ncbi:hypothetical protein C0J52_27309 [Blattella germanica]|nr:hypothetical protein C0J52_27309 [Blattella germanica]
MCATLSRGLCLDLLKLSRLSPKTLPLERQRILYHCKKLMNHFDREEDPSLSRGKIGDLLDCLADRTSDEGDCHIKAHYRMKKSWFTCIESQEDREYTWKDEQRLRRLIASERRWCSRQPSLFSALTPDTEGASSAMAI